MAENQDALHDKARANPDQDELALRHVVERSGLPITGYEFKTIGQDRQAHYFDVAVILRDRLAFIDLSDNRHKERDTAKIDYCNEHEIALLQLPRESGQHSLEWEGRIAVWTLTNKASQKE